MFKKLRKRRLSSSFKKKSSSLKDINIVEKFVHKTAKIMSASAENLNSESTSSGNLITLLDQSFQPNTKHSTAPNSSIGSPNCKNKLCNQNSKSHSTENCINREKEVQINNFYFLNDSEHVDNAQSIEVIFEENISYSEIMNSFAQCNNEDNNNEMQQSISSGIFDSPQRVIVKHCLKRSFSFNDINIRHISSLKVKHSSIQTFISTNATLSVEIENKPDDETLSLAIQNFNETNLNMNTCDKLKNEDLKIVLTLNSDNNLILEESQLENNKLILKGDENCELKEFHVDKENEQSTQIVRHDNYLEILGKCIYHPFFLVGVFVTGIIILVPTISGRLTDWLSSAEMTQPVENEAVQSFPLLQPLGPEFLYSQPSPSIVRLETRILENYQHHKENSIVLLLLPKIIQDQIKKGSAFLSKFYKRN